MHLLRRIIPAAAVLAVGISSAFALSPAAAAAGAASAPARPAPHSPFVPYAKGQPLSIPSSTYLTLTDGNGQWGATAEGVGVQIALTSNAPTLWDFDETQSDIWKIKPNGNGSHCWEQDGSELEIQNCAQATGQQFSFNGSGNTYNISNVNSNDYAGVFNPNGNKPVWVEVPQGGFYISWQFAGQ